MSKKVIIIILSVLFCICLSLGIVGYIEYNKKEHVVDNNQNKTNTENPANNNVENSDFEDRYGDDFFGNENINADVIVVDPDGEVASKEDKQGWYMLDASNLKKGKTYNYKLNDQFEIQYSTFGELDEDYLQSKYTMNNKEVPVANDLGYANTFFYYLKNYLIYEQGHVECEPYEIYIVDKDLKARTVFELDKKLDGLRSFAYDIDDTGLTVIGFRWTTEGIISYGDDGVPIYDRNAPSTDEGTPYYTKYQKDWAKYGLKEDTIMLGTYKYEYKDGVLSETPTTISEVTIKDYLANHKKYDDYVFDFIEKANSKVEGDISTD